MSDAMIVLATVAAAVLVFAAVMWVAKPWYRKD